MRTKSMILLLSLLLVLCITAQSQTTIYYGYNASGDRISRSITLLKSTAQETQNEQQEFRDNIEGQDIIIYPNPVKSELTIQIPGPEEGSHASLALYDQGGRLVYRNGHMTGTDVINFSDLSHGIYFLNISYGETTTQWKIIKE